MNAQFYKFTFTELEMEINVAVLVLGVLLQREKKSTYGRLFS